MWKSTFGFGEPLVDIDEWRDKPRRHRYVHGGFQATRTLFSFYFPPPGSKTRRDVRRIARRVRRGLRS